MQVWGCRGAESKIQGKKPWEENPRGDGIRVCFLSWKTLSFRGEKELFSPFPTLGAARLWMQRGLQQNSPWFSRLLAVRPRSVALFCTENCYHGESGVPREPKLLLALLQDIYTIGKNSLQNQGCYLLVTNTFIERAKKNKSLSVPCLLGHRGWLILNIYSVCLHLTYLSVLPAVCICALL